MNTVYLGASNKRFALKHETGDAVLTRSSKHNVGIALHSCHESRFSDSSLECGVCKSAASEIAEKITFVGGNDYNKRSVLTSPSRTFYYLRIRLVQSISLVMSTKEGSVATHQQKTGFRFLGSCRT